MCTNFISIIKFSNVGRGSWCESFCLVIGHISWCGAKFGITLDNFVNSLKEILFSGHFTTSPNRKHTSFCANRSVEGKNFFFRFEIVNDSDSENSVEKLTISWKYELGNISRSQFFQTLQVKISTKILTEFQRQSN